MRTSTPNTPGRIHVHRCCNGCGLDIGDVTDAEIDAAVWGDPLPDVRDECPVCRPADITVEWDQWIVVMAVTDGVAYDPRRCWAPSVLLLPTLAGLTPLPAGGPTS